MKSLISGIIGAAAAAVAWMALEHQMQVSWPYMALLVGLVTGIAVRSGASAGSGESLGRGALAAILALGACVGAQFGYVEYMKSVNEGAEQPQRVAAANDADSDADEAEADADTDDADADADDASSEEADADTDDSDADAADADADDADTATEPAESPESVKASVSDRGPSDLDDQADVIKIEKPSIENSMSEWDMLWLCGSALLAYVLGKGGSGQPAQVAGDQSTGSEPENTEQS